MILLKKYWPYLTIAILAVAVVILFNLWRGSVETVNSQASIIREQNTEIVYRKSKDGKIIADKEAAEARAKDLETAYPKLAKVLTEQMDIRLKNLRTSIQAEFRAFNTGHSIIIRDTVKVPGKALEVVDSVKIQDGYLTLNAEIEAALIHWNYSYQDTLTSALFIKKKWFLGKERLYFSGMFQNLNAKIVNSTAVHVKDFKDKRWVISGGVSYDPFRNQWSAGFHAGYALFRF